jgi:uncharacterized protein YegP (UPF0339 family)
MFELYRDKAGEFRFRLRDGGGRILLVSEGYKSRDSATNGIESVGNNAGEDKRYARLEASNGKHYFNLKAANGQTVGTSEMFADAAEMDAAIAAVKRLAPEAATDDQT